MKRRRWRTNAKAWPRKASISSLTSAPQPKPNAPHQMCRRALLGEQLEKHLEHPAAAEPPQTQAADVHLSFAQEISLMAIFLLSSKGVAGVPAGGFVVLAGTLSVFPDIPMAGLALLLGIDRILDAMRTMTNVLGNGVATMAIARWEGQRDDVRMNAVLNGETGVTEATKVLEKV